MSIYRAEDPCDWFRERMELFLDGELSGSENFRFQTHLKECEDCADWWAGDEALAFDLLSEFGRPREGEALAAPDAEHQPRIPRVGEKRAISQHSTTVLIERRHRLTTLATALAAGLVATAAILYGGGRGMEEGGRSAVASTKDDQALRIYVQGAVEFRDESGEWRRLEAADALDAGVELRCARDSRLLVDLGDRSHFVLDENSQTRLTRIDDELEFEVARGRFSCDLRDRSLHLQATGLEIRGRDAAFDLRTSMSEAVSAYESRIAVTRGEVLARSDVGAARALVDGEVYAVHDGLLVAFDQVDGDFTEGIFAARSRTDLGAALDQAPADMTGFGAEENGASRASARPQIESWLAGVVAAGGFNIVDPDPASRRMCERVDLWGESILGDVEALYRASDEPLARRALVALAGRIPGDRSRLFLVSAGSDDDLRVRKASLYCLSRRRDAGLVAHYLEVMRRESDRNLRLTAAFLAAARGEREAFEVMCGLHEEATGAYWRGAVVELVARLEVDFAGREDFLLDALRRFDPAEGLPVLEILLETLARSAEPEAFTKALLSAREIEGLCPAMRQAIAAALESARR